MIKEFLKQPSKITIPDRAHPFAKLVFGELKRQGVSYTELEFRSGVIVSTFKAWRTDNRPGLESIECALGALGWRLIPVPDDEHLSEEQRDAVAAVADLFASDDQVIGAAIRAARDFPAKAAADVADLAAKRARKAELAA